MLSAAQAHSLGYSHLASHESLGEIAPDDGEVAPVYIQGSFCRCRIECRTTGLERQATQRIAQEDVGSSAARWFRAGHLAGRRG